MFVFGLLAMVCCAAMFFAALLYTVTGLLDWRDARRVRAFNRNVGFRAAWRAVGEDK